MSDIEDFGEDDMVLCFDDDSTSNGSPDTSLFDSQGSTSDDLDIVDGNGDEDTGDFGSDQECEGDDLRYDTMRRLERLALDVVQQLVGALPAPDDLDGKECRNKRIVVSLADRRKSMLEDGSFGTRSLTFPLNTRHASAKGLAQLFKVVDLMHEALSKDISTTKRDIYYKDVQLFGSQAVVDRLVDDLAATIGVGRADLNVRASSKGLFCGNGLTLHMCHGDVIEGNAAESTLIPPLEEIARVDVSDGLRWVLVVEKEAVFHTLCHLAFSKHPDLPGSGLIITGKGYPDVATRQLVCTLSDNLPMTIPILALVDADPYGIDILSVYKYGSASMAHERDTLAASRVKWIGVMASEFSELCIDKDVLLPITKHDQKKALAMLRKPLPRKWKRELQHMLHLRRKAEIEVLSSAAKGTADRAASSQDPEILDVDDCRPQVESPLIRYLVAKINNVVEASARK